MTEYPILVENFDAKHPADLAVCTKCHATFTVDPGEGDPYDMCTKHGNPTVPGDCGGQIVMKYDVGYRCKSCRKLDWSMPDGLKGCCSRRCMLQFEYAESLQDGRHEHG